MFSKYCMAAGERMAGNSPYISGHSISKRDNVYKHGTSKQHSTWIDVHIAASQPVCTGTVTAAVDKQLSTMNEDMLREIKIKMTIAYCIAKEPFTKFGPLILPHKNGINLSTAYDNHVWCAEMIGQIADNMKCELANKVKDTQYLSVTIDGDTNVSI